MESDRNGHIISGMHKGVAYAGRVTNSRVRPNGEVQYTINLFAPIYIDGERRDEIVVNDLFTLPNVSQMSS